MSCNFNRQYKVPTMPIPWMNVFRIILEFRNFRWTISLKMLYPQVMIDFDLFTDYLKIHVTDL